MRRTLAFVAGLFLALSAHAELPVAWVSPGASIRSTVGITDVEVVYHRPAVKGRKVWDGLVPYGEVWRLGANEATTIRFTDAVKVAGHDVPAGTYGLFAIPGPAHWTIILSKRAEQWGAFFYKQEDDLLRFDVTPTAGPETEWMTFALNPAGRDEVSLDFAWEKVRFSVPIEVEVDKIVWARYDAALADPKATYDDYLTAAKYALERGQRLDEALVWADKSIALQESFWNYDVKARLLLAKGRKAEALPLLEKALALSRGKTPKGYQDGLEQTKKEWGGEK